MEVNCDPFEYVDGHYVGHDGFVIPKDFAEFYEEFPDHTSGDGIRASQSRKQLNVRRLCQNRSV